MTECTLKAVGERIRKKSMEMGLSQEQLAERLSIETSHLSRIENGKVNFGIRILLRILEELQVSADWLLRAETPATVTVISEEIEGLLENCTAREAELMLEILARIKKYFCENR